ncbi:hypothetical protein G7066_12835 [Leucobacter coleopterorum]|uniref:Large exoprotein n=1 Tax=Leucobacter coleopterorum TaxID=2714933 RepID=A0ABX6JYC3_9MICO|nr:hypothetical protein [Leucobacter coleopterorum]QIM19232.1 hypothetical protein G7066_12835 [Leucobacter coleopterorum]
MNGMTGGGLGGGVIFVVAALLWAAVLVPAWVRRREFRAAERNALRLQRTLRVLAETSEVPQELRLEATAKQALAHEKLLRTAQRRQEAERDAELSEARAEQLRAEIRAQQVNRKQAAIQRSAKLRRPIVRRVRGVAFLGAVVGLLGLLVGVGAAIAGSGTIILLWSGALFAAALAGLMLLAPGRVAATPVVTAQVTEPEVVSLPVAEEIVATGETAESSAAHAAAQRAAAERIERARALARTRARSGQPTLLENQQDSMLLQEAREQVARTQSLAADSVQAVDPAEVERNRAAQAEQATFAREQARTQAQKRAQQAQENEARVRLSQMGVVGDTSEGMPDLDAVLRRRRNAG